MGLLRCSVYISKRNICWYQKQRSTGTENERELRQFFWFQDKSSLVYCNNIAGLIKSMGLEYNATEWRLFIDSSSRSLKAIFWHNRNSFTSIPIGQSVQIKDTHNSRDHSEHKWLICGDLKVVGLVHVLQGGDTKYPCFLHLWDSRADNQHYVK